VGLIKREQFDPTREVGVPLDLGDLRRQGDELRRLAQEEAERILAEAHAERERIVANAAEDGHAQGLAQGLEEGRAQGREEGRAEALEQTKRELSELSTKWSEALRAFEVDRSEMLISARQDVLRLALLLAEKVIKRRVESDPRVVLDQLASVLSMISSPTRLTVRVHPSDGELARDALPDMLERCANAQHIEIVEDISLERGSCVAKTSGGGEFDASVRSQLDRIVEELMPHRMEAPGEAA